MLMAGCRSAQSGARSFEKTDFQKQSEAAQKEAARLQELDAIAKTKFAERHKHYVCSPDSVPRIEESKGPGEYFKSTQFGDHVVLKLKLGAATHANGSPCGPTRTASRYQLCWDNKLVAEAESLFSLPVSNEKGTDSRFFYNPDDHTLVVFDHLCWSTERFCVFEKTPELGHETGWRVKYFMVPESPSIQPFPDMGKILGVGNGNIYMEIDGQMYAFPFDYLLLEKLEFTVG